MQILKRPQIISLINKVISEIEFKQKINEAEQGRQERIIQFTKGQPHEKPKRIGDRPDKVEYKINYERLRNAFETYLFSLKKYYEFNFEEIPGATTTRTDSMYARYEDIIRVQSYDYIYSLRQKIREKLNITNKTDTSSIPLEVYKETIDEILEELNLKPNPDDFVNQDKRYVDILQKYEILLTKLSTFEKDSGMLEDVVAPVSIKKAIPFYFGEITGNPDGYEINLTGEEGGGFMTFPIDCRSYQEFMEKNRDKIELLLKNNGKQLINATICKAYKGIYPSKPKEAPRGNFLKIYGFAEGKAIYQLIESKGDDYINAKYEEVRKSKGIERPDIDIQTQTATGAQRKNIRHTDRPIKGKPLTDIAKDEKIFEIIMNMRIKLVEMTGLKLSENSSISQIKEGLSLVTVDMVESMLSSTDYSLLSPDEKLNENDNIYKELSGKYTGYFKDPNEAQKMELDTLLRRKLMSELKDKFGDPGKQAFNDEAMKFRKGTNGGEYYELFKEKLIPPIIISNKYYNRYMVDPDNDNIQLEGLSYFYFQSIEDFINSIKNPEIRDNLRTNYLARQYNQGVNWKATKAADITYLGSTPLLQLQKSGLQENNINIIIRNDWSLIGEMVERRKFRWKFEIKLSLAQKSPEDKGIQKLVNIKALNDYFNQTITSEDMDDIGSDDDSDIFSADIDRNVRRVNTSDESGLTRLDDKAVLSGLRTAIDFVMIRLRDKFQPETQFANFIQIDPKELNYLVATGQLDENFIDMMTKKIINEIKISKWQKG